MNPDQLPTFDDRDSDQASASEAAEAFGTTESALRADLAEEVHQRHPGWNDDDEVVESDEAAEALDRRMAQRDHRR